MQLPIKTPTGCQRIPERATPESQFEPKVIGPYRLLKELGTGGMGQVWLAEQTEPVRRRVALKLIKAGMYDASVLQRFQAERQSLAFGNLGGILMPWLVGVTADRSSLRLGLATSTACPFLMAFVLLWIQRHPDVEFAQLGSALVTGTTADTPEFGGSAGLEPAPSSVRGRRSTQPSCTRAFDQRTGSGAGVTCAGPSPSSRSPIP